MQLHIKIPRHCKLNNRDPGYWVIVGLSDSFPYIGAEASAKLIPIHAEIWYFLSCYHEQAIEQTAEWLVIWILGLIYLPIPM